MSRLHRILLASSIKFICLIPVLWKLAAIVAPTLNFVPGRGLRYAISFDDQPPQVVDILAQNSLKDWEESVKDSVRISKSRHTLDKPGYHTLKFWMVDPGVSLQKLVVDLGGVKPSYLGLPRAIAIVKLWRHDVNFSIIFSGLTKLSFLFADEMLRFCV